MNFAFYPMFNAFKVYILHRACSFSYSKEWIINISSFIFIFITFITFIVYIAFSSGHSQILQIFSFFLLFLSLLLWSSKLSSLSISAPEACWLKKSSYCLWWSNNIELYSDILLLFDAIIRFLVILFSLGLFCCIFRSTHVAYSKSDPSELNRISFI